MRGPTLLFLLMIMLTGCGGSGGSDRGNGSSSAATSSAASSAPDPDISGLDERPVNDTCRAGPAPGSEATVELERVFPSLSFNRPVALLQAPGDGSRWYLVEQTGRVRAFDNSNNADSAQDFIDLRAEVDTSANSGESGLLSMAFHPDYADNGQVFLFYQVSEPEGSCCVSQLVRYTRNQAGTGLDPDSAEVLLSFTPPYENHFGGHLAFDEQGYLYLSLGDGGSAGDPGNRAQTTSNILGGMIRLDVDGETPYAIPDDNPFAGESGFLCNSDQQMEDKQAAGGNCPELYAWGLRNPWRWSFDPATGDLWLADVGQSEWEEVNLIERGGNYGWRIREGAHCYNPSSGCQTAGLIEPVAEVPQPDFQSITGGVVYRGEAIPRLEGQYLFGDYLTGPLLALSENDDGGWDTHYLLDDTGLNIASFARDQEGEIYLLDYSGGIYQLVAGEPDEDANAPAHTLADTGCVDPDAPREPAEGLIPYDLQAPFWSDGADKRRWIALPEGESITIDADQDWQLPPDSVVVKNFYLNEELIETRLFKHHTDGQWAGYSYAWNSDGTGAELVQGGAVLERQGQEWIYPSGSECLQCHTEAAGRTLGLETAQLNRDFTYPGTDRRANQLDTLTAVRVLAGGPDAAPLADPGDERSPVPDRARAYLHTNCAQCHRPEGPTNVDMDLRAATALPAMKLCDVPVQSGEPDERRLVPGDAAASALVERMALREHADQMPPIGSALVDEEGEALLREWINGLPTEACEN